MQNKLEILEIKNLKISVRFAVNFFSTPLYTYDYMKNKETPLYKNSS